MPPSTTTGSAGGPSVDWLAVEALQNRILKPWKTQAATTLNALDRALNDLLDNPNRAATGARLAANVLGSARKKVQARPEILDDDPAVPKVKTPRGAKAPGHDRKALIASEAVIASREAGAAITAAMAALPDRLRAALLAGLLPGVVLSVKARQMRNLRRDGRAYLRRRGAHEAFRALMVLSSRHPAAVEEVGAVVDRIAGAA